VAFVFLIPALQSKAKKGAKNPHSEAVKRGKKINPNTPLAYKKRGKKNTGGFATPFNFLVLILCF
jgi:hypothetical protein